MKPRSIAIAAICLLSGAPAFAHRLDEYLQATLISVEKNRIHAQIRLTPGVAVFPVVLASIDTDADGVVSETEQRAYAERVRRDLSLTIDGQWLRLRLVSIQFPPIQEMKDGRGEIEIEFDANLPRSGPRRILTFENHHLSGIAAYLVNCLVPGDPDIRVMAQKRNYQQSFYQLEYAQAGVPADPPSFGSLSGGRGWLGILALSLLVRLALLFWRPRHSSVSRV
jgi:hypothetical protein